MGGADTIHLVTPDNAEKFIDELSRYTPTNVEGFLADDAELSTTSNRTALDYRPHVVRYCYTSGIPHRARFRSRFDKPAFCAPRS